MKTLSAPARHESTIKRSRFVAIATRLSDENDLRDWLTDQYDNAANHHCWAWRCGQTYRFDDDGEPGGTAGRPILQAIEGQALDQVAVVVLRYFGGIKLGTGGLIRAYGGTAAECLRLAEQEPLIEECEVECQLPFDHLGTAYQLIDTLAATRLEERFESAGVVIRLRLPTSALATLEETLRNATRGQARCFTADS